MITLRATQPADVRALYGKPLPMSITGLTAVEGERILGMGAIYPSDGCMVLVCQVHPAARPLRLRHARAMLAGAHRLLRTAAQARLPVRAFADRTHPGAAELIERLGFRHVEKDVYEWATPT